MRDREQELWAKERGTFSGLCISAQPLCCAIPVRHVLLSPPTSAPIWVSWHGALPPASGPYFSFPPPPWFLCWYLQLLHKACVASREGKMSQMLPPSLLWADAGALRVGMAFFTLFKPCSAPATLFVGCVPKDKTMRLNIKLYELVNSERGYQMCFKWQIRCSATAQPLRLFRGLVDFFLHLMFHLNSGCCFRQSVFPFCLSFLLLICVVIERSFFYDCNYEMHLGEGAALEVGLHNNSCIGFFRFCDFCLMHRERQKGEGTAVCYEEAHAFARNFHPLPSAAQAAASSAFLAGEVILLRCCCTSLTNLALQFQSRACAGQDNSVARREWRP